MTILLSGASGFLGSFIQKKILSLKNQRLLTVGSSELSNLIRDKGRIKTPESAELIQSIRDVSTVLHIGSYTPKNAEDASNQKNLENIEFTSNLLDLHLPKLKTFIYTSSIDVYGNYQKTFTEHSYTRPNTLYAQSKLASEILVRAACIKRDANYSIVRVGHLFGPGDSSYSKFLQNLIKAARERTRLDIYGDGSQLLQLLDVRDAAEKIIGLMESSKSSSILNLVHPTQISLNQLIEKIEVVADVNIQTKYYGSEIKNRSFIKPSKQFGLSEENLRTVDNWLIENFPQK